MPTTQLKYHRNWRRETLEVWDLFRRDWWGDAGKVRIASAMGQQHQVLVVRQRVPYLYDVLELRSTGGHVFIRKEYLHLYKRLKRAHKTSTCPAVILTGSPGIGKCYFLVFALLMRMAGKHTTLVTIDNQTYLFDKYGVWSTPTRAFIPKKHLPRHLTSSPWSLIGTGWERSPPYAALCNSDSLFTTQTVKPDFERWMDQSRSLVWYMQPWSKRELLSGIQLCTRLSSGQKAAVRCLSDIERLTSISGPCMPELSLVVQGRNNIHRDIFAHALDLAHQTDFAKVIVDNINRQSNKLFCIRRIGRARNVEADICSVDFKSPFACQVLSKELHHGIKFVDAQSILRACNSGPDVNMLAAWIFQMISIHYTSGSAEFGDDLLQGLFPMELSGDNQFKFITPIEQGGQIPYVYPAKSPLANEGSQSAFRGSFPIRRRRIIYFRDLDSVDIHSPDYHFLSEDSLFDGFFCHPQPEDNAISLWFLQGLRPQRYPRPSSERDQCLEIVPQLQRKVTLETGLPCSFKYVLVSPQDIRRPVVWTLPEDLPHGEAFVQFLDLEGFIGKVYEEAATLESWNV